jgi:flagellar basal-body rod protein FlgF
MSLARRTTVLRTLQSARQAMHLEQTRIDALANNLANAATSGFRQVLTRAVEQLPGGGTAGETDPAADQPAGLLTIAGAGADAVTLTHILDPRPGQLQSSGRATDLALVGRGFFVLQDAEGNEFYTRDGAFRVDEAGHLVSAGGHAVQGSSGPIEVAGGELAVDERGNVTVGAAIAGRLRVVDFAAPEELQHRGEGLLVASEDMEVQEVPAGETTVMQGYLEGSNVDPVRTLVDMIAAQRAFEIEAKVLQANDDLLNKSVNVLGRNA